MSEDKVLKIEICFDENTTKILDEMRDKSKSSSNEQLLYNALRIYDWFLNEGQKYQLYQKRGSQMVKIQLQL